MWRAIRIGDLSLSRCRRLAVEVLVEGAMILDSSGVCWFSTLKIEPVDDANFSYRG
jgi:collagenase-like PrtC family protease